MTRTNWRNLLGNKLVIKPTTEMITAIKEEGVFVLVRNASLRGGSRIKKHRTVAPEVEYDEAYLECYLASKLEAFFDMPWNDLLKLMKRARERSQQKASLDRRNDWTA